MKVYAALTSWPKRIVTAHETIESMLNQSAHLDGVELNLYSGDFPDGISSLPKNIRDIYADVPNFSIHFHDRDLKVWLKSVPSIRRHRGEEYTLFTLDDDCVYDVDYVLEGLRSLDSGDFDAINNQSGVCKDGIWQGIAGEYMAYRSSFLEKCRPYLTDDFCEKVMVDDCCWFWLFRKFGVRQAPRTRDGLARDRLLGYSYRRCFKPGDASTKPKRNGEHPTMKPVELFEKLVENSSRPGENVLDSFGGSGTTMVACEKLGRKAFLCELDPKYADVIVKRFINLHGNSKDVRLLKPDGTEVPYDEILK